MKPEEDLNLALYSYAFCIIRCSSFVWMMWELFTKIGSLTVTADSCSVLLCVCNKCINYSAWWGRISGGNNLVTRGLGLGKGQPLVRQVQKQPDKSPKVAVVELGQA